MSKLTQDRIKTAIGRYHEPTLDCDLVTARALREVAIDGDRVAVRIELGFPARGIVDAITAGVREQIAALPGVGAVTVDVAWKIQAHAVQKALEPLSQVKNIIAVASGKGGVGKSTTAANLALALHAEGACVGLLDADIYGPSQPRMLGIAGQPQINEDGTLQPLVNHGIQAMSIGFLIEEDTPMIWRGPMVTQALSQLLNDTRWSALDYLIVDLPPGTGDTQLTLAQKVPVAGALIVTTPQDIALLDAVKGLKMFEKVEVPVLGVVENMSTHVCSNCGHEEHIFGEGGGRRMAEQHGVELLGNLPLDLRIRLEADSGQPTLVAEPDSRISATYREIARLMVARLSRMAKSYASAFPNITIKND